MSLFNVSKRRDVEDTYSVAVLKVQQLANLAASLLRLSRSCGSDKK